MLKLIFGRKGNNKLLKIGNKSAKNIETDQLEPT